MKPHIEAPAYTQVRGYTDTGWDTPLRPRTTVADIRRQERAYARQCIRTIWIIAALLTAVFAWIFRQPPFAVRPELIQVAAVTVNGIVWWVATTRIWFREDRRG